MANMREVNKAIKVNWPNLDIQVVRGDGYVYYDGVDGFDKIESLMVNPVSCKTNILTHLVFQDIEHHLEESI